MTFRDFSTGRFYNGDCLEVMKEIPDSCIDMILCDLPYGTTACKWDTIVPFDKLWAEYWRICKPNASIILTAVQPFTANLLMSQIDKFKYELIWRKNSGSGFSSAKFQPLRYHESILVFCKTKTIYNPQPTKRLSEASIKATKRPITGNSVKSEHGSSGKKVTVQYDSENKNPESVLDFNSVPNAGGGKLHPTQKPVALFEYLIKTYSNEGMLILDNTAGSGTTAIAAINTNRRWVCIEQDPDYYAKACERIENHGLPTVEAAPSLSNVEVPCPID